MELEGNRETIKANISKGEYTLLNNLEQLKKKIDLLKWSTIVVVFFLFLASFIKSRGIIRSITEIVRETRKIEKDFRYRIQDDPLIQDEFHVLIKALNSMATKTENRVENLHEEIKKRMSVEDKLSRERERLDVTLKSIGDGVITTDTKGRIVLMNKVAEQLTGWSPEMAVGKSVENVFNIIEICGFVWGIRFPGCIILLDLYRVHILVRIFCLIKR